MSEAPQPPLYWVRQRLADVPVGDDWLAPEERRHLATLRVPKRRADWRLGRWTVKRAVARLAGAAPERIAVLGEPDGAPAAWRDGQQLPITVSLSHSGGHGFCVAVRGPCALGCDVEVIADRGTAFVRDYFTPAECAAVARSEGRARATVATLLWSAKEAALKALHEGLRLDTRAVEVDVERSAAVTDWQPMAIRVRHADQRFAGWWRQMDELVFTIAASPDLGTPRELHPADGPPGTPERPEETGDFPCSTVSSPSLSKRPTRRSLW